MNGRCGRALPDVLQRLSIYLPSGASTQGRINNRAFAATWRHSSSPLTVKASHLALIFSPYHRKSQHSPATIIARSALAAATPRLAPARYHIRLNAASPTHV